MCWAVTVGLIGGDCVFFHSVYQAPLINGAAVPHRLQKLERVN